MDFDAIWRDTAVEGLVHIVRVQGAHMATPGMLHARMAKTKCGQVLPSPCTVDQGEANCEDCLYGDLDGVLREFSEAPAGRELVTTGPVPA